MTRRGFTIVELLIVIVVVAILAGLVVVGYNGTVSRSHEASVISDTRTGAAAMGNYLDTSGAYPDDCNGAGIQTSSGNTIDCNTSTDGSHFCISVSSGDYSYYATDVATSPSNGSCSGPTGVPPESIVTAIDAGAGITCAIINGNGYCWGDNYVGQLGTGDTTDSETPVAVNTSGVLSGKTLTDISTGDQHTCAVADGAAYCWGAGVRGQLGTGVLANSYSPVAVSTSGVLAGKTVTKVSASGNQTCVVADGAVYCFGDTYSGALGNGVTARTYVPDPVAVDATGVLAGKTVTDVSIGEYFSYNGCVVASGQAYCWGANGWGQVGDGTTNIASVPIAVDTSGVLAGKTVTSIETFEYHTCAIANGQPFCWGGNGNGYLGNNEESGSAIYPPVAVDMSGSLAGKTVTAIAPSDYHTCAIADGKAYCWGNNYSGTLGNGLSGAGAPDVWTPGPVDESGVLSGKTVTAIAGGYSHTCVIASNLVHCWGDDWFNPLESSPWLVDTP